ATPPVSARLATWSKAPSIARGREPERGVTRPRVTRVRSSKERADRVGAVDPLDRLAEEARHADLLDLRARLRRLAQRDRVADDDLVEGRFDDALDRRAREDAVRRARDDARGPVLDERASSAGE